MNHAACARWARWAPGAVRAWYADHPGACRAERAGPLAAASARVPDLLVERAWAWIYGLCGAQGVPPRVFVGYCDAPEDVELDGESPGLAVAAALIAWVLERAPRRPVVVSAALAAPGHGAIVGRIDFQDEKRRVCAVEAPAVACLVADRDIAVGPHLAEWFGESWRRDLARVLGTSAWRLATEAWDDYRAGRQVDAERGAASAIELGGTERNLAWAWLVRGACRLHRGETADAVADLEEAERRLLRPHDRHEEPPDPWEQEELDAFLGVALVDSGRPREAVARLEAALARLLGAEQRDRRWRLVALQVAGTLHRARVLAGNLEGARDALEWVLGGDCLRAERGVTDAAGHPIRSIVYLAAAARRGGPTLPWALVIAEGLAAQARGWPGPSTAVPTGGSRTPGRSSTRSSTPTRRPGCSSCAPRRRSSQWVRASTTWSVPSMATLTTPCSWPSSPTRSSPGETWPRTGSSALP